MIAHIELPKSLMDSALLATFFEVKAPDVVYKDAFLHGIDDKSIDCNIYHPKYNDKYGYLTTSENIMISGYMHVYKCPDTRQNVVCRIKPLSVLCVHEDGIYTNKDGSTVVKVDWVQRNRTRQAESEDDFSEIYLREFTNSKLLDLPTHHEVLKETIKSHVQNLIELHQKDREYGNTLDLPMIAKANEFLKWLLDYHMPAIVIDGILFSPSKVSLIHKKYNDIIFSNVSEQVLSNALNFPELHGTLIKAKPRKDSALQGLIKLLEEESSKEWGVRMINVLGIDPENYRKKANSYRNSLK